VEVKYTKNHKTIILKQKLTNWENILIVKNKDLIINFEIKNYNSWFHIENANIIYLKALIKNLSKW
jgi:hypothetical protein